MPRRRQTRRTLLVFAGIVAFFTFLVVAVRFFQAEPVYLLPHDPIADAALRDGPENAYPAYLAMLLTTQQIPESLRTPAVGSDGQPVVFEPPPGSAAQLLDLVRPDDDPALREFLLAQQPALDLLDAMADLRHFIPTEGDTEAARPQRSRGFWENNPLLLLAAAARAFAATPGAESYGIRAWCNLLGLTGLMGDAAMLRWPADLTHRAVHVQMRHAIRQRPAPPWLVELDAALRALGPPIPDRHALLEGWWRSIDRMQSDPASLAVSLFEHAPRDFGERMRVRAVLYFTQRGVRYVAENKERFYDMVTWPPARIRTWQREHRSEAPRLFFDNPYRFLYLLVHSAAVRNLDFGATRIAIALERRRAEQGAYPATLDALVPETLDAIPPDELSGAPLVYQADPANDSYRLYSVGINGIDDGGAGDKDFVLVGAGDHDLFAAFGFRSSDD